MGATSEPSGRPRWGRRILVAVAVAATAYVALLVLASRYLDPETLASLLEPRLEEVLARDVEISSAKVGFLPLGMRIQGVTVSDPTGMAPVLARVEAAEFQVRLIPLLRRQIRVRRILIESPEAHLRVSAEGVSNYGDFSAQGSPSAQPAETDASLDLVLRSIRISGGRLSLTNEADSVSGEIRDLSLDAQVQHEADGPWLFSGESEGTLTIDPARDVRGATPSQFPLALSFDLRAAPAFQDLEILSGRLGSDPVTVALSGEIHNLRDPVRTLSLQVEGEEIPFASLLEALPERILDSISLRGEGTVALSLSVEGEMGPGTRPEVSGQITLTGGGLLGKDDTRLAQHLAAQITLLPESTLGVEAEGEVMNGPFALEGTMELPGQRELQLHLDMYPDLALARDLLPALEERELQGRVRADVHIQGPARDPAGLRFVGEASPSELRFTTEALAVPIAIHDGQFDLRGSEAAFRELSFSLGRDRYTAQGGIGNLSALGLPGEIIRLRGSVRGSRLDLTALSVQEPPDPTLSYGKVAFARVGGRMVAGRSAEDAAGELRLSRPDSIPLAGEIALALDTVIDAKGRMENVRAVVGFGPTFVRVSQASFQRYGGTLRTGMNVRLGRAPQQPFSLNLSAEDVDAGTFLGAASPLGPFIQGRLSFQMELAGALDALLLPEAPSLIGSGSFSLRDGGLNSMVITESMATFLSMEEVRAPEFQDWSTSFFLEDGRVQLAEAALRGAPGEPRLGGGIGVDGGLDLLSAFSLPTDRLSSYAQRNLGVAGELAGQAINRPDFVQAIIHIGGSVLSPELGVSPGGGAGGAAEAATDVIRSEAQRRIREQTANLQNRASSFLRRMTQGAAPDTSRPDTVQTDTLQPDTIPPDTIPPDTIPPDTIPPDTIPPDTTRVG